VIGPKTTNFHISSKKTAGERSDLLRDFLGHKRALMTNARCMTEGVDVPAIDCVMFADPKGSRIDIVQAAGRALRRYRGKECGYIVVPLIVPTNMAFEEFAETTAFRQVAQTITALSIQDERIADEFRAIERGRISSGKIVEIEGDIPVGMKMKLGHFAKAISTQIWESVGRANWRTFTLAREFVRDLGLESRAEWDDYCKSDRRPFDIPAKPNAAYAHDGWIGMGDWLGTGTIATHLRKYRPFQEARRFVCTLGLKSQSEWNNYANSDRFRPDLPKAPHWVYANAGWRSWGDWLGSGRIASYKVEYRPFEQAREFARNLGLKTREEWLGFARSDKLPRDIPIKPERTYAGNGWSGMGDWLGTGTIATHLRKYRPFAEAGAFARTLGLSSAGKWRAFCKSGLPPDIPANPYKTYLHEGPAGPTGLGPQLLPLISASTARTLKPRLSCIVLP
jgi:hypothetical protein